MSKHLVKQNTGLSLIELLVGMAMAAIIFIVASSLVVSLMGSSTKNKYKQSLAQAKNDIVVEVTNTTKWADALQINTESIVSDTVEYKIIDGLFCKNGIALTGNDIKATRFKATRFVTSFQLEVDLESKNNGSNKTTIKLFISPRSTAFAAIY